MPAVADSGSSHQSVRTISFGALICPSTSAIQSNAIGIRGLVFSHSCGNISWYFRSVSVLQQM